MFQEPVRPTASGRPSASGPGSPGPQRTPTLLRGAIALIACLALAVPVVFAFASAPRAETSQAGASASPAASAPGQPRSNPGGGKDKVRDRIKGFLRERHADSGRGLITITGISGSSLSLATADGWKRTIEVTPDTTITKGGTTAALSDLQVGDAIRFRQHRNDDGTYTITAIVVPTPRTGGTVSAVSGDSITITRRDGSTQTITVDASTVYTLGNAAGSMADVTVGARIVAEGMAAGPDFAATAVHIALMHVAGTVTATTTDSITIVGRGGSTTVIHVSDSTKIAVRGKDAAAIADIAAGDRVQVQGVLRSDGSIDATDVHGRGPKGAGRAPKTAPSESPPTG